MLELDLLPSRPGPLEVLCLGAHADDLEIGCSGTLLTVLEQWAEVRVTWVVFSAAGPRGDEASRAAARILEGAASTRVLFHGFRDGFFPYAGGELKECFEKLKLEVQPDLVLTHGRDDLHQDHRTVSELSWNTWRDHTILEYEIPKYDGDLGTPNVFVPIARAICARKLAILMECFASQRDKHWFSEETFRAMLRLRGLECRSPSGYAEAFQGRKLRLGLAALHAERPAADALPGAPPRGPAGRRLPGRLGEDT